MAATGDTKTEAEGKFDQAEGKAQNTVGGIKDKARELLDDKLIVAAARTEALAKAGFLLDVLL